MTKQKQTLQAVEELLAKVETDIKRARLIIEQLKDGKEWDINLEATTSKINSLTSWLNNIWSEDAWKVTVVEWVYDGYFMIWSDKKKYPVPLNYSSKTKLIPGDVLKLRIMGDGKLIYKLISQANRKFIRATLSKSDENKYTAISDEGEIYYLNQAAVSYFKWKTWDELSIIVNSDGMSLVLLE